MKNIKINLVLISASLYSSFQVIANVLSVKIVFLPLLNLPMDGGTLIYPLTFTLRDFVHKSCGKKNARMVVVVSALVTFLMVFLFWLVGIMRPDPSWLLDESYKKILMPVARISFASIIAQAISELIDTEIFSYVYKKLNDIVGSFISNLGGLLADSIIFCLIAFAGVLPIYTVIGIIISNILIKIVISGISVPLIKFIPRTVNFDEI